MTDERRYAEWTNTEPNTQDECLATERAICGAIGWISATANEGNNPVYQETVKRLAVAAGYFSRKAKRLAEDRPLKEADKENE